MIKKLLEALKMNGALEALASLDEITNRDQYLIGLLKSEIMHRENRASKRRLSQAKFPTEKEWSEIDQDLNPSIHFSSL